VAPGDARNADPGGRSRSGRGGRDKAAWWMSRVACGGRCISNVSKYIDQRHGRFRKIKAAGDGGQVSAPFFTRIDNTEN
jgi:hypothetical protein